MDLSGLSTISWYPGHMRKAEREIREKLSLIDVVVELVDARAPSSTRNGVLDEIVQHKSRVLVIAKCDLALAHQTRGWQKQWREQGYHVVCTDATDNGLSGKLKSAVKKAAAVGRRERGARNSPKRRLRAMVVGLPNVGKSTLINRVVHRKRAETGRRPGVTRHQQWIAVSDELELLDTPGIMVPRVASVEVGLRMGLVAAIKNELIGEELLAEFLFEYLSDAGDDTYLARYGLGQSPAAINDFLEQIGRRRGFLSAGGQVDHHQAAVCLLNDFQDGRLGRLTLEFPNVDTKRA